MNQCPKVIENDALVVVCLADLRDAMTHFQFKQRAKLLGFELSKSQCHNLLHRASGRVWTNGQFEWRLTTMGFAYRQEVLDVANRILKMSALNSLTSTQISR